MKKFVIIFIALSAAACSPTGFRPPVLNGSKPATTRECKTPDGFTFRTDDEKLILAPPIKCHTVRNVDR